MSSSVQQTFAVLDKPAGYVPAFVALVIGIMAFQAWYQSGSGIITVKEIANHNVTSPSPKLVTVVDVSGAEFMIGGARYAVLGGQNAQQIRQLLKKDCRYEISYYWDSSSNSLWARDFMVISGATLIDCSPLPPSEPKEPQPSAREIMERLIRPQQ
jgi:hypothetical protein